MEKGFQDRRYRELVELLVAERKRRGLSQEALARQLGWHQQGVSRFELGERRLDVVEFIDIARVLGLPVADVVQQVRPSDS